MLHSILPESFFMWFRNLSAPLPEDFNRYITESSRCLDVGAGNGFFLKKITATKNIAAVEIWQRQLINLQKEFPGIKLYRSIDEVNEKFDLVLCIDVLHHVEDNSEREIFLSKLYASVAPGGHLIIKEMRDDVWLYKYFNRLSDFVSTRSHTNEMNERELRKRLESNGFRIIRHTRYRALLYGHYYLAAQKNEHV